MAGYRYRFSELNVVLVGVIDGIPRSLDPADCIC